MEVVASARVVCRSRPVVAAIPHIGALIASFLAPQDSWTVEDAIHHGCKYLARHLLGELANNPALHPLAKRSRARRYLSMAATLGDIALLEHLMERFECCADDYAIYKAVKGGQLEALKWLFDRALAPDQDVDTFKKNVFQDDYLVLAGEIGPLEMLQWMHTGVGDDSANLILRAAAARGQLRVIEWVLPMVKTTISSWASYFLALDVMGGAHIDVIEFLQSKSMLLLTPSVMDATVLANGQLELLQWMYDNGGEGCTHLAVDHAASNGRLDVLHWLFSKGLSGSTSAMDSAAGNGHLEVVKFLHENRSEGCTHLAFKSAVHNNHVDVAQYLFEHRRGDCTRISVDEVARTGGFETLQWLQTSYSDAEYSARAMDYAAINGHLDIVQFLHSNRTEGCTTHAIDRAAQNGHLDVIKWLHFNRTEGCTTKAMDKAAKRGHLETLRFLHSNRSEGCTTKAMDNACNVEILRWLGENRHEGFTERALFNAAVKGDVEMLVWLSEHAPAEMWTSILPTRLVENGRVEALEWFADVFPSLFDPHELLMLCNMQTWWVWSWLKQRVET